jgi:PIN domain nuclease of toxin-antitoxin system
LILLDTHVLVWWVNGDRLSPAALSAIDDARKGGGIGVSSISAWEIAMLVAAGRLALSMDVAAWLAAVEAIEGVSFVPVDNAIAVGAVNLPGEFHKDPADRIIVATARALGAELVSADGRIGAYKHVRAVW